MLRSFLEYFKGVWSEFAKITFPSRTVVIKETFLVIASIVVGVFSLMMIDYAFTRIVALVIKA